MDIIDIILNELLGFYIYSLDINNPLLDPWIIEKLSIQVSMDKLSIQPVPFTINNYHFELFKPELYLCCCLFSIVLMSVYFRKFYNMSDVSIMTYKSVCLVFIFSFILQLKTFFWVGECDMEVSTIIFNSAINVGWYTIIVKLFILFISFLLLVLGLLQFKKLYIDKIEFSILIGFSTLFIIILISSSSLLTLYLSIEALSLTGYILAAYPFKQDSFEAAIKYFSLGALSSGLLLYGIIILYGITGSFDFHEIKLWIENSIYPNSYLNILRDLGISSILFGFCFKLAIFPCHMWALDVYEGTWLPVTSFFMIVVKVGVFLTFIRLCTFLFFGVDIVYKIILLSSLGSLFIGAIGSLSQKKLKRFFTYSSLSQLGFSILGLITGTMQGLESSFFFFILYLLCSLGVFLILLNTEKYISGENLIYFTDFTNFGKYNLGTSLSLCIILFSMAGIPPLGGFFSKALVIKALIESSFYGLAIYGIIMGAINTFIYIRLIKCIISDKIYTYVNKDIPKQYSDYFLFRPHSQAWHKNFLLMLIVLTLHIIVGTLLISPIYLQLFLSFFNFFSKSML